VKIATAQFQAVTCGKTNILGFRERLSRGDNEQRLFLECPQQKAQVAVKKVKIEGD
jgi:hypothetical protein